MLADGHCRTCGEPVKWVMTTTGNRMPLNPMPDPDGNCYVDRWDQGMPVVVVAVNSAIPGAIPIRYTSHFATCPQADKWRKKR